MKVYITNSGNQVTGCKGSFPTHPHPNFSPSLFVFFSLPKSEFFFLDTVSIDEPKGAITRWRLKDQISLKILKNIIILKFVRYFKSTKG